MIHNNKTVQYAVYNRSSGSPKFVGDTTTLTRPNLELLTDTIKGAGILGEVDMPTISQLGSMTYEITLRKQNSDAIALFEQKNQEIEVRWISDYIDSTTGNSAVSANKDIVKGVPKSISGGNIENNTQNESTVVLEVLYIKHIQDGETKYEIDKLNNVFIINGVDYGKIIRDNL